jgi:hypothetical protein
METDWTWGKMLFLLAAICAVLLALVPEALATLPSSTEIVAINWPEME